MEGQSLIAKAFRGQWSLLLLTIHRISQRFECIVCAVTFNVVFQTQASPWRYETIPQDQTLLPMSVLRNGLHKLCDRLLLLTGRVRPVVTEDLLSATDV